MSELSAIIRKDFIVTTNIILPRINGKTLNTGIDNKTKSMMEVMTSSCSIIRTKMTFVFDVSVTLPISIIRGWNYEFHHSTLHEGMPTVYGNILLNTVCPDDRYRKRKLHLEICSQYTCRVCTITMKNFPNFFWLLSTSVEISVGVPGGATNIQTIFALCDLRWGDLSYQWSCE
jgi:hypothetical protein